MNRTALRHGTGIFFIIIVLARLLGMWAMPLADVTEARYGEIARKMLETGDWITLWHDYGVPFWGKPPLSTWLAALSMKLFGINELAARAPAMLLALGVLLLTWRMSRMFLRQPARWLSVIILSSMTLFYIESGTVTTDMSLLFSCTLALVSFWYAIEENNTQWGYIFFAALGIGLLAKGPVAVVLVLLPISCWLIWTKNWKKTMASLPWRTGALLTSVIGIPWYVAAEIRTPGFLRYFIVGEHIKRFLVPSWKGDLYGYAHQHAPGTIWLFLLIDALPWLIIVMAFLIYRRVTSNKVRAPRIRKIISNEQKYIWCWFLASLAFFTLSRNITRTYTLTSLPALALLISSSITPIAISKEKIRKWVYGVGLLSPAIFLIVLVSIRINPDLGQKSGRNISRLFQNSTFSRSNRLSYVGKRLYSMDFYNAGKAQRFDSIGQALGAAEPDKSVFLALTDEQVKSIPASQAELELIGSTRRYRLFKTALRGQK